MKRKIVIIGIAAVLCLGGCRNAQLQETTVSETQTQETTTVSPEPVKYVSDEDWDALVKVYQILEKNYGNAGSIVSSGQATGADNPEEILKKAEELIEYGKTCGKEDLTSAESNELLISMVDTADKMLSMIEKSGGTIISEQDETVSEIENMEPDTAETDKAEN